MKASVRVAINKRIAVRDIFSPPAYSRFPLCLGCSPSAICCALPLLRRAIIKKSKNKGIVAKRRYQYRK
jgi:hypothetical protein